MNKTTTTLLTVFISSLFFAQEKTIEIKNAKVDFNSSTTKLPLQISFEETAHINQMQFGTWFKKDLVNNLATELIESKTERDALGYLHQRHQQYYNGYKIEGSMIITHVKNGEVKSFNGEWYNSFHISNSWSLSEKDALLLALNKVGAKKYKWENQAEEIHMQEVLNNPNFSYKPKGEKVLYPTIINKEVIFNYAYKFNIYAEEPLYRANIYIDASTGKILNEQNLICTIDAVGTANTKYSGTQTITTDNYTSGYRLRESGRGLGIETYNLNNSSNYTNTDFTNTVNTWTTTGNNQAATDAHFGAEATYDYYLQTFGRNSIDNNGYKLLSYVHYSTNYVNAFWDGQRMTYGDGSTSQGFTIMTALDVCGHEITHGLVENTANLGNGEAGALNEAFADIFGTSVEWFARPNQHDWIMGKDIMTNSVGIRNMSNPNAIQQPDTYQGTYWDNAGEVHTNDGPCIYWFYLLSVGGNGTNDKNQVYNVNSITMAKAQAIAYRALTTYMTPGTTYADVRNYTIQAAKDLFGACSNEVIQTTNAWYAVGVGNQYAAATIAPAFNTSQVSSCNLPLNVDFINTTAAGQNFKWEFGDGTISNNTNPSHTYTANGTYSVKLVAEGCSLGQKDSVIKTSYIVVNAPIEPNVLGDNVCEGGAGNLTANGNGTIKWYDAPTAGNVVGTGSSFSTPTLSSSVTYYAINTITQTPIFGGPATNTVFGGGSNFNANTDRYLIFDVLQPCTLKTVKVVANSAGNRVIELRNSTGIAIQTKTVNIAAGTQTVTLDMPLPAGTDYQLKVGGNLVDLYRNNSGSGYPYNIGNLVSIKTADAGSSYYYYFYNWQVQQEDCQSNPVAVTATVNTCTNIKSNSIENSFSIFPNPATDKFTLSLNENLLNDVTTIEIYDALGKLVYTSPISSLQTDITVSNIAKGIYTCKISANNQQTLVKRFIKE